MIFQVPASIEKVETMADHCLKLRVDTIKELVPEEEAKIMSLRNKIGWFVFSDIDIKEMDIPAEPIKEFKTDKTPGQRLRAAMYVFWESKTNKMKTFDNFYKDEMEKVINRYKENLN